MSTIKSFDWAALVSPRFILGTAIILALAAFEVFNFDSTRMALEDFFYGAAFWGVSWAIILGLAACAIDLSGMASIFTPQGMKDEPWWIWLLMLGIWVPASIINATLTWYAISVTMSRNPNLGHGAVNQATLAFYVPIVLAVFVWMTRVSIVGSIVAANGRFLAGEAKKSRPASTSTPARPAAQPARPASQMPPTRPAPQPAQVSASPASPINRFAGLMEEG